MPVNIMIRGNDVKVVLEGQSTRLVSVLNQDGAPLSRTIQNDKGFRAHRLCVQGVCCQDGSSGMCCCRRVACRR